MTNKESYEAESSMLQRGISLYEEMLAKPLLNPQQKEEAQHMFDTLKHRLSRIEPRPLVRIEMDLPTSCRDCRFLVDHYGLHCGFQSGKLRLNEELVAITNRDCDGCCPLQKFIVKEPDFGGTFVAKSEFPAPVDLPVNFSGRVFPNTVCPYNHIFGTADNSSHCDDCPITI